VTQVISSGLPHRGKTWEISQSEIVNQLNNEGWNWKKNQSKNDVK